MYDKYHLPDKPKLFESFSGIGCQRMAFDRLGIDYEMVGISEIDKYALQSYMAIHGDTKNYGSITDIKGKDLPQIDVFTYSFPCTDLSKAGKQKGLSDTRSGLVYEVLRILQELKVEGRLPNVLIMENVVDLVQTKFIRQFQAIQLEIEQLGYTNYTQTLNAKNYGVAQNRDRVFVVSILGEYSYEFPKPILLDKRLKDYLEDDVDEKYYIKDYDSTSFINDNYSQLNGGKWEKLHDIGRRFYSTDFISPTIHTMGGGNLEPKIFEPTCLNPQINGKQPSLTDRIYDSNSIACAVATTDFFMPSYTSDLRIRKLTPLECWQLMGISDDQFHKAEKVCSNSQLYKQAVNGIVVDVFMAIIKNLI